MIELLDIHNYLNILLSKFKCTIKTLTSRKTNVYYNLHGIQEQKKHHRVILSQRH